MTKVALRTAILLVVAAAIIALFYASAPHYSTVLWWELRRSLFWLLPLLGLALLAAATMGLAIVAEDRTDVGPAPVGCLGVVLLVAGFVVAVWWAFSTHGYLQARDYYLASATTGPERAPLVGQRAPYPVAEAQARSNLGDVAGDVVDTTYLLRDNAYSTLVKRRGIASSGYEAVLQQEIPLAGGRGEGTTCRFGRGEGSRRDSGWWSHNLARAIHGAKRNVRYDSDDLYAYCKGETPIVVVPLKKQVGWMVVAERPAGVALYDGSTGKLSFRTSASGLPGPTYPLSLAAEQRESLKASGGYWDYRGGRSGYEETGDDTNSGNTTEFVLPIVGSDGRSAYVTMLTGRGSATAISAVSYVDGRVRSGRLAPIVVHHTRPGWVSPSAIVSRIQADYQDLPNWQNQRVLEVAPLDGQRWVATIGNGQNVLYRVQGTGDLKGKEATCLLRADGSKIRCGTLADQGGNSIGTQYGSVPGVPPSGNLSGLTNAQLADLQRRVADEVSRRLKGGK